MFLCLLLLAIGIGLLVFDKFVGGYYNSNRYGGMQHGTISGWPLITISIIMLIMASTAFIPKKSKTAKNKKIKESKV